MNNMRWREQSILSSAWDPNHQRFYILVFMAAGECPDMTKPNIEKNEKDINEERNGLTQKRKD